MKIQETRCLISKVKHASVFEIRLFQVGARNPLFFFLFFLVLLGFIKWTKPTNLLSDHKLLFMTTETTGETMHHCHFANEQN